MSSRRTLSALAVAGGVLVAGLTPALDQARAAYSAGVSAGTLTITGDGAADKLALRLLAAGPNTLVVDVGDDGSADFLFDRTTFTDITVTARNLRSHPSTRFFLAQAGGYPRD